LDEIKVPAFITHGDKDKYVPYSLSEKAASRIPNSELYTVKNAGHAFMIYPSFKTTSKA